MYFPGISAKINIITKMAKIPNTNKLNENVVKVKPATFFSPL